MSWEQSRQKRTIATSRGDDNRDEPKKRDNGNNAESTRTEGPEKKASTPSAIGAQQPRGKLFPLDILFQERSDTPEELRANGCGRPGYKVRRNSISPLSSRHGCWSWGSAFSGRGRPGSITKARGRGGPTPLSRPPSFPS